MSMSSREREEIISRLHGQKVRIPNLYPMLKGWPTDLNANQESVRAVIDGILEKYRPNDLLTMTSTTQLIPIYSYSMSKAMERKLKNAQLNWLLSGWFPYTDDASLKHLTSFVGWMFLIDDEIDQVSKPGADNEKAFDNLYDNTLSFLGQSLGLPTERSIEPTRVSVKSFEAVGKAIRERYTAGISHRL